jgi:hypothetical protein
VKPTAADLWLWEAAQARDVPAWARALDAERAARAYNQSRREKLARLVHQAINARAGSRREPLSLCNTLNLLQLVRSNQTRAITAKHPGQFQDNPELRTLAEYMQAHGFGSLNGRAYSLDKTRHPHYRRFLRRMRRAKERT